MDSSARRQPSFGAPLAPVPADLTMEQRTAIDSLKTFLSVFKSRPPSTLLGAKVALEGILYYVRNSGYPVRHLESHLENTLALCLSFVNTSSKSLREIGADSCAMLLKEAEERLTSAQNEMAQIESAQSESRVRLMFFEAEYAEVSMGIEELEAKLSVMKERKSALQLEVEPQRQTVRERQQSMRDVLARVDQARHDSQNASAESMRLKDDREYCAAVKVGLLGDLEARIGKSFDDLLALLD